MTINFNYTSFFVRFSVFFGYVFFRGRFQTLFSISFSKFYQKPGQARPGQARPAQTLPPVTQRTSNQYKADRQKNKLIFSSDIRDLSACQSVKTSVVQLLSVECQISYGGKLSQTVRDMKNKIRKKQTITTDNCCSQVGVFVGIR